MKVFQLFNGTIHWETPYKSIEETKGRYPTDVIFVEAPDYVFESWDFDGTKEGDARFIKPTAPEGWVYDESNGTFYDPVLLAFQKEQERKQKIKMAIAEKFGEDFESNILKELFADMGNADLLKQLAEYNAFVKECEETIE